MIRVYNDRFCWKKKKEDEVLIVQMKMEDFASSSKPVSYIFSPSKFYWPVIYNK